MSKPTNTSAEFTGIYRRLVLLFGPRKASVLLGISQHALEQLVLDEERSTGPAAGPPERRAKDHTC